MGWYANQKARNEGAKARRKDKASVSDVATQEDGRGTILLSLLGTCKGTYRVLPDGTVTYNDSATDKVKKDRVIGNLRDGWDATYEATAQGPAAFQSSGGEQFGSVAFVTVVVGEYVKSHKIETLFAGSGSHVHAKMREQAIRSNILASKFDND